MSLYETAGGCFMSKKLLCVGALIALLALTGCAPRPMGTFRTADLPFDFKPAKTTADLDVGETKITGRAELQVRSSKENLEPLKELAILNALRSVAGNDIRNMPDILVEPRFIFERNPFGHLTAVVVVGYPAKFTNFRNVEDEEEVVGEDEIRKGKGFIFPRR